jgi:hypothetical protein
VACLVSAHIIFSEKPSHQCANFLLDPQTAKGYETSRTSHGAEQMHNPAARVGRRRRPLKSSPAVIPSPPPPLPPQIPTRTSSNPGRAARVG